MRIWRHCAGSPDIGREELARFFTLTPADVAFIDPGRGRGPADRMGLAVTLCSLPWLGFVPDVAAAPQAAAVRLAGQLQVDPDALRLYGRRAKTRTEHLRLVARYLGWRVAGPLELKELDEFLLARALEHDTARNPRAIPLDEFADNVIALLESQPEAHEILVDQVKLQRYAERRGDYEKVFGLINGQQ